MTRWLTLTFLLCGLTFGVMYFFVGPITAWIGGVNAQPAVPGERPSEGPAAAIPAPAAPATAAVPAAPAAADRAADKLLPQNNKTAADAIRYVSLDGGRLLSIEKQEVPAPREGVLMTLGTPLTKAQAKDLAWVKQMWDENKLVQVETGLLLVEIPAPPAEDVAGRARHADMIARYKAEDNAFVDLHRLVMFPGDDTRLFQRWKTNEPIPPNLMKAVRERRVYRKLQVNDPVQANQIVGIIEDDLAVDDLTVKVRKLEAAAAEKSVTIKLKEEAKTTYDNYRLRPGGFSEEDVRRALLTWRRYEDEERVKDANIMQAQTEISAAYTVLKKHEIRAAIPGEIKAVYKNPGDAVRNLDAVMQLRNSQRMRVETLRDAQDVRHLKVGTEVLVEPTRPEPPLAALRGHLHAVTCVAVSRGENPVVISGSEDKTLRGWDPRTRAELWKFTPASAVRCMAASGPAAKGDFCVFGTDDGWVRKLDLGDLDAGTTALARRQGSVSCVAVNPAGTLVATAAGTDVFLYDLATGQEQKLPAAHGGPVTSLAFVGDARLVSAGRDGKLQFWSCPAGEGATAVAALERRGGAVTQLGVDPVGGTALFDNGKELKLISLATRDITGVIENFANAGDFGQFAAFDPQGLTVLTQGGLEGRMQLWRVPRGGEHAAELRQLIAKGPATSAAFAPDGSFAATGMQDNSVLLWEMPKREKVTAADGKVSWALTEKPLPATISLVEKHLESGSGQVRVWAELKTSTNLTPGGTAVIVIDAKKMMPAKP